MKLIKKNIDLFLLKLFTVNSIGVILKTVLGFISQKLLAVYIGPNGIALVGNLKNVLALIGIGSTTGVDQGVLVFQSEFDKDTKKLNVMYSTSLAYSVLGSLICFFALSIWSSFWSLYFFQTTEYNYIFIILAFSVPFAALYNVCFAVINGKSDYKRATLISLTSHGIITLLVIILVLYYNLSGVLLAVSLSPIIQFLTIYFFARKELLLFIKLKVFFHEAFKSKMLVFSIISFTAVLLNNLVELGLRNYLIEKLSITEAGYWTSMMNFSNYYLSFMAGIYSLYVLPNYAKVNSLKMFKIEYFKIFKFVVPLFCLGFVFIYLIREQLITLLFTSEFLPMQTLFKWQLLGDILRIISVLAAYQFIAKKHWQLFIITEIVSYISLYIFSMLFIKRMGVEGIVFAHFLRYIVYLFVVMFSIKYVFKKNIE